MKKTMILPVLGAGMALLLGSAGTASAHFLWLEVPEKSSTTLRVTFGEEAPDATTPRLLERIQKARAWTAAGRNLDLKLGTGALTADLAADSALAGAEQTWDVLDRSEEGRGKFLLNYYAKAAGGIDSAAQSVKLPVEVFAKRDGGICTLTVRRGDAPAAGAEVWAQLPGGGSPLTLKTDAAGEARFALSRDGEYQVRAMVADPKPGTWNDKPYELVRNYSTLTFHAEGKVGADEILSAAQRLRETWNRSFPGFTAHLRIDKDGEVAEGPVKVAANGEVELKLEDPDLNKEAVETFQSIVTHRLPRPTSYQPSFGPEDRHPQGRSVLLGDTSNSMYRIKDGQIMQVNRDAGPTRFTIDMLSNTLLEDGKYLPSSFTVSYRDAKNGKLLRVESYSERYEKVGGYWLPVERQEVNSREGATSVTRITLSNLLLNAPAKTDE